LKQSEDGELTEEKRLFDKQTYYYACSYPLSPGSVIEKGNWGRICRLDSKADACPKLLMEVIFESVRLRYFPERPSRFDCNFLCPNLESFRNFLSKMKPFRPFDLPYEVEIIDLNAKRFETDWSLISPAQPNTTIETVEQDALRYWSPQNVKDNVKEVLVESDIKIIRRLTL
jgi:hypothetical protein